MNPHIDLVISEASESPIYQQIYDQISTQIMNGSIERNTCLPPIRTVAKELRISVITVKRAWEELERSGLIHSQVGRGCFVASLSDNSLAEKRNSVVTQKLSGDIAYYKELGFSKEDIIALINELY